MPTPLIITLPAGEDELRDAIEERLGAEANVYPVPPTYAIGLDEIKLLVEIAAGGAALIKTLLEIKQYYAAQGKPTQIKLEKPGAEPVMLDQADAALLRQLLDVD